MGVSVFVMCFGALDWVWFQSQKETIVHFLSDPNNFALLNLKCCVGFRGWFRKRNGDSIIETLRGIVEGKDRI